MPERAKAARLQSLYSDWSVAEQLALVEAVQRQEIWLVHVVWLFRCVIPWQNEIVVHGIGTALRTCQISWASAKPFGLLCLILVPRCSCLQKFNCSYLTKHTELVALLRSSHENTTFSLLGNVSLGCGRIGATLIIYVGSCSWSKLHVQ